MKLMVFVLHQIDLLNFLLEDMAKSGIKGATIIHSTGLATALSKVNSSFIGNSLKSLFEIDRDDNRTILAVINDDQVDIAKQVITDVVGDLSKPNTGILFTVPLDFVDGIRK